MAFLRIEGSIYRAEHKRLSSYFDSARLLVSNGIVHMDALPKPTHIKTPDSEAPQEKTENSPSATLQKRIDEALVGLDRLQSILNKHPVRKRQ